VRPRVARRAPAAPDRSRLTTAPLGTSRSRSRGRLPGEHQVLGGRAARLQGPRAERAPPGDRRRHARHVGRAVRRVPGRAQTDVLGAQDRAGVGRAAEAAATRAKGMLHEIMEAPSRGNARQALERFGSEFDAKYPKAGANLDRDWAALTAFGRALAAPAGPPTRSRAASLRSISAPASPRAPDPRRPRSRWPTSCCMPPSSADGGSTAMSSSSTCSPAWSSRTGCATTRLRPPTRGSPPDPWHATSTTFLTIALLGVG
jgi:hypothetical protein